MAYVASVVDGAHNTPRAQRVQNGIVMCGAACVRVKNASKRNKNNNNNNVRVTRAYTSNIHFVLGVFIINTFFCQNVLAVKKKKKIHIYNYTTTPYFLRPYIIIYNMRAVSGVWSDRSGRHRR